MVNNYGLFYFKMSKMSNASSCSKARFYFSQEDLERVLYGQGNSIYGDTGIFCYEVNRLA